MSEAGLVQAVSVRRAVELALDAARGLAYLHKRKPSPIVHRDLKPANLMISGNLYQVGTTSTSWGALAPSNSSGFRK